LIGLKALDASFAVGALQPTPPGFVFLPEDEELTIWMVHASLRTLLYGGIGAQILVTTLALYVRFD
jgi:hypothetical protein